MRVLRMADGGDGGGAGGGGAAGGGAGAPPADIKTFIPAEYANEPSIQQIKTIPDFFKSYVSAQKMIGADKVAVPQPTWTPEQWNDFYTKIGRPGKPEEYEAPKIQLHESLQIDPERLSKVQGHFHKLGLTKQQAAGVLEYYFNSLNEGATAQDAAATATKQQAMDELTKVYGGDVQTRIKEANDVLTKLGTNELKQFLVDSGAANNAHVVQFLVKIGQHLSEDVSGGGGGGTIGLDAAGAAAEIQKLRGDENFMKLIMDETSRYKKPAEHKAALEKWTALHKAAYPAGSASS